MRRASSRQVFNARPDRRTRNPGTADRPSDPPDVPKDFLEGLFRRWSSTDQRTGRTFGDDRLSAAVRLAASLRDPRACRVALLGQYILNPTLSQLEYATMEMVLAGHKDALNMIEVGALEVPEAVVTEGIAFGQKAIIEICGMIEELQKKAGKPKSWTPPPPKDELNAELRKGYGDALRQARQVSGKQDRYSAVNEVYKSAKARYAPEDQSARKPEHDWNTVRAMLDEIEGEIVADMVVRQGKRSDGRGKGHPPDLVRGRRVAARPPSSSARDAVVVRHYAGHRARRTVDGLTEEYSKKFMLYNFPPLCTGEPRRLHQSTRDRPRNLAEKSLEAVLPTPENPLHDPVGFRDSESNGSVSITSVCGGCLR